MGTSVLLFALLLQASGPQLAVEAPGVASAAPGERVVLYVRVSLDEQSSAADISLRPLSLTNFKLAGVESGALLISSGGGESLGRWFRVGLEPVEPGEASVGPVEVEISSGDGEPLVLKQDGFSLRVVEPFRWGAVWSLWPWGVAVVLLIGAAAPLLMRRRRKQLGPASDSEIERWSKQLEKMDLKLRRGDFRGASEAAYEIILSRTEGQPVEAGSTPGVRGSDDLRAALRLGEEVRYAGYTPDRSEAAFIARLAREMIGGIESKSNTEERRL